MVGDAIEQLKLLPDGSVHCAVTSPPYWGLRDYGVEGQIGQEPTPDAFVSKMVEVFREVRRVIRDDGTFWLNIGDSYNNVGGPGSQDGGPIGATAAKAVEGTKGRKVVGLKPKDLCMIPWRLALALQADGWYLRSVIVWAKKSPMPESISDRPTSAWEPIFLLTKSERYFYDAEAVKQPTLQPDIKGPRFGGNKYGDSTDPKHATKSGDRYVASDLSNLRNVWRLGSEPCREAHFAVFPSEIPRRAIKAGTSALGCCVKCAAPWRRVTAKQPVTRERPNDYTKRTGEEGTGNSCANTVAGVSVETLGWFPTCKCDGFPELPKFPKKPKKGSSESEVAAYQAACAAVYEEICEILLAIDAVGWPIDPCIVLDPFLGSGTTVATAREMGHTGIGIELNPEYAKIAEARILKAETEPPKKRKFVPEWNEEPDEEDDDGGDECP